MAIKRFLIATLCFSLLSVAAKAQTSTPSADYIGEAYGGDSEKLGLIAEYSDHAILAWAAYKDQGALSLAADRGWETMSYIVRVRRGFKSVETARPSDDVIAVMFRKGDPKAFGPNDEYVVAFRGSDFTKIEDWVANGQIVLPILPEDRVKEAADLAQKILGAIATNHPGELRKFDFVGHSLGGRLAMVARHATGRDAVVFNSSPLSAREIGYLVTSKAGSGSKLVAFRSPQDPLVLVNPAFAQEAINIENIERARIISGFREVYPNEPIPDESGVPDPDFATAGSTPAVVEGGEQFSAWIRYNHSIGVLANAMQDVRTAFPAIQQQQVQAQKQPQQAQARTVTNVGDINRSATPAQKPRDCRRYDELSRALAACLLLENKGFPWEIKRQIRLFRGDEEYQTKRLQLILQDGERLAASGLVTLSKETVGGGIVYGIDFTDRGRVWVRSIDTKRARYYRTAEVVAYVGNFGEVTGIFYLNEAKSIAQVEYTVVYEHSPFGRLRPFGWFAVGEILLDPQPVETKQATLKRYDDGWRVAK